MTPDELIKRFPNASAAFVRANSEAGTPVSDRDSRSAAKLERHLGHGDVGQVQIQKPAGGRFLVVVKAFRKRLLDIDNLCEKYHVDLLRYAGIIPSDAPGTTEIKVCQEKVGSKEREFVRIEVFQI